MTGVLSWVVGSGGLLGAGVERALRHRGDVWRPEDRLPWGTPVIGQRLRRALTEFAVASTGRGWQVAWCAGTGVPSTAEATLREEEEVFNAFLDTLAITPGPGALFVASSAGGVYAGSSGPPFTEHTDPRPLAPYGESKLRVEQAAYRWGARTGHPVVVGRISNLYGLGQNLSKTQGLISHLCRAQLKRAPVSIYVSMDTVRDYLWADDAGQLVADCLDRARTESAAGRPAPVTKVLASEHGTTVGALVAELRRVHGRPTQVVRVASAASAWQTKDLRVRSVVWADMGHRPLTPLPVGIAQVLRHLMRQQQHGRL